MRNNKAQSSVEYLLVVAMALMIIIPGSFIFYSYSANSKNSLMHSQVFKIGNTLIDTATKVYSIGDDSWNTIEISLPEQIKSITIYNSSTYNELIINYGSETPSDGVFFSTVQLCNQTSCNCTIGCNVPFIEGINKFRIMALDGKVYFQVVK
ncbi:MAG: hypothetical protein AB7V77_02900 [Candidatus Woesearchaeota archaeon]